MSDWVQFLPLILLAILFWFLVLRPARARQREFQSLQQQIEPGLKVMLTSGIHGEVVSVSDDVVELRIAPQTVITVARPAIASIFAADAQAPSDQPPAAQPPTDPGEND